MFAGLRKPEELMVIVVTLLAYGCPPQAIVHAALVWMNEPWPGGKSEQERIVRRSMRIRWSRESCIWDMSKPMRFG